MNNNLLQELSPEEKAQLLKLVANEETERLREENTKFKALVVNILSVLNQ